MYFVASPRRLKRAVAGRPAAAGGNSIVMGKGASKAGKYFRMSSSSEVFPSRASLAMQVAVNCLETEPIRFA